MKSCFDTIKAYATDLVGKVDPETAKTIFFVVAGILAAMNIIDFFLNLRARRRLAWTVGQELDAHEKLTNAQHELIAARINKADEQFMAILGSETIIRSAVDSIRKVHTSLLNRVDLNEKAIVRINQDLTKLTDHVRELHEQANKATPSTGFDSSCHAKVNELTTSFKDYTESASQKLKEISEELNELDESQERVVAKACGLEVRLNDLSKGFINRETTELPKIMVGLNKKIEDLKSKIDHVSTSLESPLKLVTQHCQENQANIQALGTKVAGMGSPFATSAWALNMETRLRDFENDTARDLNRLAGKVLEFIESKG